MLNVVRLPVGPFQANAYLAWDGAPGDAVLVDAGAEAGRLLAEATRRDLRIAAVLQTHAHADHIAALPEVVASTQAPVYLHPDAVGMLTDPEANLSAFAGVPLVAPVETTPVTEHDSLRLLDREVVVYETPGHAPGSVCYRFVDDGVVFTGDALFAGSIGRTDLPGGDFATLIDRIRTRLLTLPDDTRVYPGHMGETTIGRERASNPFLQK